MFPAQAVVGRTNGFGCVLFPCEIHAIFPGHTFKGLDIAVCHFDIEPTRALPDKVYCSASAP